MPRYIDADDAIYRLNKLSYSDNQPRAIRRAAKYLDEYTNEAPAADVQEVKHAYWMLHIEGYPEYDDTCNEYECSNCGCYDIFSPSKEVPYCWHCGAKMDGDENV